MRALFYTVVARIRDFLRPAASEADFEQELEAHLAMAEEDKVRRGMSPEQARREARLDLGGAAQLREAARAARGLPWLETFWLDAKLGLRMLRRSWGLTLVGGLAMAVTIGLGASMFTIWDDVRRDQAAVGRGRSGCRDPAVRQSRSTHSPRDAAAGLQALARDVEIGRAGQRDAPDRPGGDHARRRRRFCARGRDDRLRLPARARPATAWTTVDGRRRARGRRTGRRDRL